MGRIKTKNKLRPEQILCIREVDKIMLKRPDISIDDIMKLMKEFCQKNGFELND